MTMKVNTYCTSATANVYFGATKNQSNANTLTIASKNRRPAAQLHRNWNHCEQIQHHDVGKLERPMQRYRNKRCDRRRSECCRIAGPDVRSRDTRDSASRSTLLFVDPGEKGRRARFAVAGRRSSMKSIQPDSERRDESLFNAAFTRGTQLLAIYLFGAP
jgi:hypothetical protein